MDRSRFTREAPGTLITISYPFRDSSFIPDPLPPVWKLPYELWSQLSEAKRQLGELNGIGRTLPSPQLLLRPLQQREALRSSSLEGTYATPAQLLLFELEGEGGRQRREASNPWVEVANYGQALRDGWEALAGGRPFSLSLVRELHTRLLRGVRGQETHPGKWRSSQVYIGSDRRYVPPPADRLQDCLEAFEKVLRHPPEDMDPLVFAFVAHYQFEAIHPFADGNGRVGRLLLALMAAKGCGLRHPWLYLSPFFERYKDDYIDLLFSVSARGAWTEWIRFCIEGTIRQARDAIRRLELLLQLRGSMQQKTSSGSGRLHSIVEQLFALPMLTIPLVRDRLGITYPTAKTDVFRLVKLGILRPAEWKSRPQVFYAPQIFRVAYEDLDERP